MEAEKTREMWEIVKTFQSGRFTGLVSEIDNELQNLEDLSDTAENIGTIWRLCKENANDGHDVIVKFEKWLEYFESKLKL